MTKLHKLPQHVAIIMDGNGRWAKQRHLPRIFGHKEGIKSVKEVVETAVQLGIKYLSLYVFSTENWSRPKNEIKGLFSLLKRYVKLERENIIKNNIKVVISGDLTKLPLEIIKLLNDIVKETENNNAMILNLCINYGGRQEIIRAINSILNSQKKEITLEEFNKYLYTNNLPDPDLLIRTSGEQRISNFMLWQIAYTELYFTKTLWPDFRKKDFIKALKSYQKRERRFGGV